MELIALLVVLAAVVAGVMVMRARRASGESAGNKSLENLDTLHAWEPTPTRILTAQERLAYGVLVRALPEYMVLAQVPLSRFLKVPTRNSYTEWLSRVGQLCADLVVCDSSSTVVAIIDVRVPPHQASDRSRKRHDRMKRVLKAAGIPLHVWIENALPTPDAAREAILPARDEGLRELPRAVPNTPQAMSGKGLSLPTLDDETAGIKPDEVIELGEPPPSTWFDNLESRPAPLRQVPKPPSSTTPRPPIKTQR
jgi:hypothetical protein